MANHQPPPLLTIGMPVYNGENFIARAIESILSQSFTDFHLLICDNASTDATAEICHDFADREPRILYLKNSGNIGAAANFNKVFHEGKGKYFKWAAHDDELAPGYLEKCVAVLEQDDTSVLCHSQVNVIDATGKTIQHDPIDPYLCNSDSASQRFNGLIRTDLDNYEVFGVIRRNVLQKTPLIGCYIASDRTLRAELGLHGKFTILSEPLFLCRDHPARSIRAMPTHRTRGEWFSPNLKGRFFFPHWRIFSEYFTCISRVKNLSAREKLNCHISVFKWLGAHQNLARLLADPLLVLFPGMENFLIRCGKSLASPGKVE